MNSSEVAGSILTVLPRKKKGFSHIQEQPVKLNYLKTTNDESNVV